MTARMPHGEGRDHRESTPTGRAGRGLRTGLAALALVAPAVALAPAAQAATDATTATPSAGVAAVATPTVDPTTAGPTPVATTPPPTPEATDPGAATPTPDVTTAPAAPPTARPARRRLEHYRLRGSCEHVYYVEIGGRLVQRSVFGGGEKLGEVESVRILRQAGFTWDEMQVALATMTAESERCPKAIGYNLDAAGNVLTSDIGVWQINLRWHPQYQSWDLTDPLVSSRAAREIYLRSGWTAWNAYKYHDLHMNWAGWAITLAKQAGVR